MSKPTSIPGLRGVKSLGVLAAFYFDAIGTFKKIRSCYGDVAEFPLPGRKGYLVSDPELVREVLQADESRYARGQYNDALKVAFGNSLGIAKGKIWARQRKLLQPFFQKRYISQWHPIVIEETADTMQAWSNYAETGERFDVCLSSASLLQRVMGRIMFGTGVPKSLADRVVQSISMLSEGLFLHFFRQTFLKGSFSWITTPGLRQFDRAIEEYDQLIESILAMEASSEDSLITLYRRARYADTDETMSDEQIRDEVATFFFAGQETTVNSLSWTLYYLAKHPEISDRIADEMERVSGGHPLTYNALGLLKFTKNVVNESLRLRPPVYAIERESMDSSNKFVGCPVKRGSLVTLSQSVTHCHPEYWDDPEQFNPDRFEADPQKFTFFPFGGGSRICIGKQLAMMEMITFVATAAYHYRFELAQTKSVKAGIGVTLYPRDGVFVKIKKREMKAK